MRARRVRRPATRATSDAAPSSTRGQVLAAGRPFVPGVGRAFHVRAAVGEFDEAETAALVEAARALVLLEDPELQAMTALALRELEQLAAEASPLRFGLDVQLLDPLAPKAEEGRDLPLVLGHPGRPALDEPPAQLRPNVVVDPREVRHLVARCREDAADLRSVCGPCAADHQP